MTDTVINGECKEEQLGTSDETFSDQNDMKYSGEGLCEDPNQEITLLNLNN